MKFAVVVLFLSLAYADPPVVWPSVFSATLLKVDQNDENIHWTKIFYDWTQRVTRYDFYANYHDIVTEGPIECSILFGNNSIWFIFPQEQTCRLRTDDLPPFAPNWIQLLGGVYVGDKQFRGVDAHVWNMKDPDNPTHTMVYYGLAGNNFPYSIPLRSPNQINDPGSTDFVDVIVQTSLPSILFQLPSYCLINKTEKGCG